MIVHYITAHPEEPTLRITPSTEKFGAVITDVSPDLRELTDVEQDQIRAAFAVHGLLVFRAGREIAIEEQIAASRVLGTLIDQAAQGQCWFNITNLGGGYDGPLCFHADFSNSEGLLTGACLYASACRTARPQQCSPTPARHTQTCRPTSAPGSKVSGRHMRRR